MAKPHRYGPHPFVDFLVCFFPSVIRINDKELLRQNHTGTSPILRIMYIYHALVNCLNTHMIPINLNMKFYTHAEHSPTKNNLHKVLYGKTNKRTHYTHTHTRFAMKDLVVVEV